MQIWSNTWKPMNLDSHVDQFKKKKGTISINAEKASDKIQYPFMLKTISKQGIEGDFFNLIKNIYRKPRYRT